MHLTRRVTLLKVSLVFVVSLSLSACVGTIVGAAVDTTIEIAKVPFKVVGAAVDVVTSDSDSKKKKRDKGDESGSNAEGRN